MKTTLEIINRMQADGVIGKYAIGGAVGAAFYLEPSETQDVDVFVMLKQLPGSLLVTLEPIYEHLKGYERKGEYIVIGGWMVQFLPPADALGEEALEQAFDTDLEGVPTRIMTPEHLVALALQLGRTKDLLRIQQFIESGTLDAAKLDGILARHSLLEKWRDLENKYDRGTK